jgi:hypothetical protein
VAGWWDVEMIKSMQYEYMSWTNDDAQFKQDPFPHRFHNVANIMFAHRSPSKLWASVSLR